ncbi:16S rRNA (adenine1518-N6/adenine1519-N6)-dimethyltransferase [Spiroplasma sp. TIUS-1]|uniref:16S rRNA (adenine(1518)-N(6)/adenine(1519)-N(6))- dimethyltransferase RsmA n=1 Tax=Spiroplasma sp. TIUS-1 TaxID=216963 RepID=UPI00139905DB|nr:16S rRNA (adenine1518-N6/adenine1519-N6)-dimethyltransferase [Spiroplasma sp. TIUS-1]
MQAKKHFGQNFITDKNLINKIINCLDEDSDLIIEIGPGMGALTGELVNKFKKVIAIEIDKDLEPILREKFNVPNFELVIGDVLEKDFKSLIDFSKYNKIQIISNIPYYITSPIMFKVFEDSKIFSKAVFMVQKEVAQRICANVGEKSYNNLSITSQFYSKPKYEFTVGKQMFKPVPAVDSAIISLDFKDSHISEISNPEKFVSFVRQIFNNRRKTILNNLSSTIGDKPKSQSILNELNIKLTHRPENLSLDDLMRIYKNLK